MAAAKSLLPSKRRVAVLIGFFLLLAILFSLFQFYYIPSNRDKLNEYGFMMLHRIKLNIAGRDNDLRKYYSNLVEDKLNLPVDKIRGSLEKTNFSDQFIPEMSAGDCMVSAFGPGSKTDLAIGSGFVRGQDDWLRQYSFGVAGKNVFGLGIGAREFFEPAFSYRKELFESYLVMHRCKESGIVLYHDPRLGVNDQIVNDTALSHALNHNTSQILDIQVKGVHYKLFTYPFQLGEENLMLGGIVKADKYNNSVRNIPAGFVYPALLLILVLLVALPFLKPYLLSQHEKLNIRDLHLMAIALFGGLTLITLVVIQALIFTAVAKKEKHDLRSLSKQVETAFLSEIGKGLKQLDYFDSTLIDWNRRGVTMRQPLADQLSLPAKQSKQILPLNNNDTFYLPVGNKDSAYYFMERVAWINAQGHQTVKAQLDTESGYQLINVSQRDYFQKLRDQKGFILPGHDPKEFVIDPIYSWTAGDFKINLSQRSGFHSPDSAMYTVLITRFASLVGSVFPAGYGYCLVDDDGNVLTHSDEKRNLRENFLDETGRPKILTENIASRQSNYINRIMLYGRPHAIYIAPVRDMPLHLIIFHDKTYRVPVNLRIAAFALVFMLLFYLIAFCALMLFRSVFRFKLKRSIFRPAIAYREWMLPGAERNRFYVTGIGFIVIYVLLFLVFCVFSEGLRTESFVTLMISLLTPVNLIALLFLLERALRKDRNWLNRRIFFTGWAFFLVFALMSACMLPFDSPGQRWQYMAFESFWLILSMLYWFLSGRKNWDKPYEQIQRHTYLTFYSWFTISLIVCFTILPASIFTWYAHNYEIRQSVKKQQLHLSSSLADRRDGLRQLFRNHPADKLPTHFFEDVQYRNGLYSIYSDSIFEVKPRLNSEKDVVEYLKSKFPATANAGNDRFRCVDESESFYLDLADNLARNYNDPTGFPALASQSSDSMWYWFHGDSSMYFYRAYPYSGKWPAGTSLVNGLMIRSVLPPRFELLSHWSYQVAIVLFTIGLLILLVNLIRFTAARIFLPDHTLSPLQSCRLISGNTQPGVGKITGDNNPGDDDNIFIKSEKAIAKSDWKDFRPENSQYQKLKEDSGLSDPELIELVDSNEKVFEQVWGKLDDKQRLLLLDMAQDGLINYRNVDEIRDLVRKGMLVVTEDRLQLFSYAFGYYLRVRKSMAKKELEEKFDQAGTWSSFRTPLMVIILSFAVFIFATQEDLWNKMIGLVGSLTAILTLLQRFIFSKGTPKE